MLLNIDNLTERVTIEITFTNTKNMLVSCIYRKPGSNIDKFNKAFKQIITPIRNEQFYLCLALVSLGNSAYARGISPISLIGRLALTTLIQNSRNVPGTKIFYSQWEGSMIP